MSEPKGGPAGPKPTNAEIASMLRELALRMEMQEIAFKPQAFERAAFSLDALEEPLEKIYRQGGLKALDDLPAVGSGIAKRIEEVMATGRMEELESLRKEVPVDLAKLSAVEGLGPKSIRSLHESLGVRTLEDLSRAAREGRIRSVPGFGVKTEQKILQGVEFLGLDSGRLPFPEAMRIARRIEAYLKEGKSVRRVTVAGSLRRCKETIGDIDILAVTDFPGELAERFAAMPGVVRGATRIAGDTEESVYAALGLPWIPPELREQRGEIEAAKSGRLPRLIEAGDLTGDLQVQTSWTDGANTMEEMVQAALQLGRSYIAITDHTRDLRMAKGNDEARLLRQADAVRSLDRHMHGIRILAGAELNIRKDGSLDIADEVLAELDVVGAGIHSHFDLPREETTRRMIRAMENPNVDILFHPSARNIGRRRPVDFDADAVFAAARRTGTVLEIDAQPSRLDLKDEHVRRAVDAGVKLVISSDAHSAAELRYPEEYGIGLARRGWAAKKDILNTLPMEKFLHRLKGGRVRSVKAG